MVVSEEKTYHTPSGLTVERLQPAIGAEVSGLSLSSPVADGMAEDLRQALYAHGVIFLRNQPIEYEQHVAFSKLFGTPIRDGENAGRPEILEVRARSKRPEDAARQWHSDGCYQLAPPAVSILRAITPSTFGGDTCFSSATAAYAGLPETVKQMIGGLRYRSSLAYLLSGGSLFNSEEKWAELIRRYPPVDQPVVRVHPHTGAPALYVNGPHTMEIIGLENALGRELLRFLVDEFKRPEYQMRWKWEKNAIAIWDNCAVQHYGVPDQMTDRYLERITVAGERALSIGDWEKQTASTKGVTARASNFKPEAAFSGG